MIPSWGKHSSEVPPETQFLLLELAAGGPYAILLPLISGGTFRATLRMARCTTLHVDAILCTGSSTCTITIHWGTVDAAAKSKLVSIYCCSWFVRQRQRVMFLSLPAVAATVSACGWRVATQRFGLPAGQVKHLPVDNIFFRGFRRDGAAMATGVVQTPVSEPCLMVLICVMQMHC